MSSATSSANAQISFDDIIGHQEEKQVILEAILKPLLNRTKISGRRDSRTLLLAGPPGIGKSMLARAIEREVANLHQEEKQHCEYFHLHASELISRFASNQDNPCAPLESIFRKAMSAGTVTPNDDSNHPTIICIDDADCILEKPRHENKNSNSLIEAVTSKFLELLDEIIVNQDKYRIVVVCCVFRIPQLLRDDAIHRFSTRLILSPPSTKEEVTEILLRQFVSDNNKNEIKNVVGDFVDKHHEVLVSSGTFTGADLTCLGRDAQMEPIRELAKKFEQQKRPLSELKESDVRKNLNLEDFEKALTRFSQGGSLSKNNNHSAILEGFSGEWKREFEAGRTLNGGCTLHYR